MWGVINCRWQYFIQGYYFFCQKFISFFNQMKTVFIKYIHVNDWSTFSHNLLCFKKYKSCWPDFSSKRLLVILMFPLLINSFLLQGSYEITRMVALGHWFLAEILESIIPLTSSSKGLWPRLFVPQRMKISLTLELSEKSNFCILHNTCCILSPGIPKSKSVMAGKSIFSKFQCICRNWR